MEVGFFRILTFYLISACVLLAELLPRPGLPSSGMTRSRVTPLNRRPLFGKPTEVEMVEAMVNLLGTPTDETWPGVTNLPLFPSIDPSPEDEDWVSTVFGTAIPDSMSNLLTRSIVMCPMKRISAFECLNHPGLSESAPLSEVARVCIEGSKKS